MSDLLTKLDAWKPFKAIVVGDFMLDEHLYGDAERLSADAPVPILHIRKRDSRPGGAANVCLDLIALKASVTAIGVIGDDDFGKALAKQLASDGVETYALVRDASRPTTVKQNMVGLAQGRHPQKMFRVDFESREPISSESAAKLLAAFERELPKCDVVCIEDYAKGVCSVEVCQGVIERARKAGKPVFVDPAKLNDYARYRGCTTITPNRTEAEFATGIATDHDADVVHNSKIAAALMKQLTMEACVLTLDKHGAVLIEGTAEPVSIPTVARQVYDVTGAGDAFLAGLAAARANKCTWTDSVKFANAAAGLEVEIFGVQPIPLERIHHSLLSMEHGHAGKLRTLPQLMVEVASRRRDGQKVVFTNGCFDLLHTGHISLLEKSRQQGDMLIVAVNTDASVGRLKGPGRPINTEVDRAMVLGALACVDAVVLFGEDTPLELIKSIKPDVLIKGADYSKDKVVGADVVEAAGGKVVLIDLVKGRSTTGMVERMKQ